MLGLIFTYCATAFGVVGALFNPFIGVLTYVCFAIIQPDLMWFWSVPTHHYSRIIAVGMLVGWAIHGFGRWNFTRSTGIIVALFSLWAWASLSALNSANHDVAWDYLIRLAKIFVPVLVGLTLIDSISKLKQLAWVIMLSQSFVAYEMNLSYFQGFNRIYEESFAGMDNNGQAIAMVCGVGLAFFLGIGANKWWLRFIAWGGALLMAHSVMLAFSRGGMLALIVSMAVSFLLLPPKKPIHIFAFFIIVLIGLRLAGPPVQDRFMTIFVDQQERDGSAGDRLELWVDNVDVMLKNPLLGIGPDHWPLIAHQYGWEPGKEGHSLWLQTGAELGIPGLSLLMLFYGLCMIRLWPFARGKSQHVVDPWIRDVGRMVIASSVGFIVSAQFVSTEGLEIPYYIVMLGAGALKLAYSVDIAPALERQPRLATATSGFQPTSAVQNVH
jgi:probable O-glycosylation ligase (exosortase A-associated)